MSTPEGRPPGRVLYCQRCAVALVVGAEMPRTCRSCGGTWFATERPAHVPLFTAADVAWLRRLRIAGD